MRDNIIGGVRHALWLLDYYASNSRRNSKARIMEGALSPQRTPVGDPPTTGLLRVGR